MRINSASVQNWILPVATLVAWEILGRAGLLPRYLSTPSAILLALWELALTGELFVALAASLYRVSVGFVLGTAAGIVCFAVLGFLSDRMLLAIRSRLLKGQMIGTEEQVVR